MPGVTSRPVRALTPEVVVEANAERGLILPEGSKALMA